MSQLACKNDLWEAVKGDLQSLFPQDVYRTWFESLECLEETDEGIVLGVSSEFAAIWIQDNYHDLILKRLQMATGRSIQVSYRVATPSRLVERKPEDLAFDASRMGEDRTGNRVFANPPAAKKAFPYLLNPKNTFDNFVVGPGNQLAHAASIAVANQPGRAYNPLFLYGDTGLGKTHLMHAVAHHVLEKKPDAQIAYISTEKFTNEFIRAIQENTLVKFRQRYRHVDILLIDDIHFLAGKERIQEEFFHTFNDLFEAGKQIFLCSDRPASEISKLENRLVSRFQWGLVTDIQAPEFETRLAILTKKANTMGLELPDAILHFLAERVARNVRRMEGALTRVAGYVALTNGLVDIPSVEKLLHDILQEEAQMRVTIDMIQKEVCDKRKLLLSELVGNRRPNRIAYPRQMAMYLCRMLTSHSLQEIGEAFGGRDHGTVIHACKAIENWMEQDASKRQEIEFLQNKLSSGR